jgi:hypothetical protein
MPESTDTPIEQFLKPAAPNDFGQDIIDTTRSGPDGGQPTMSSREIAALTSKRHDHVMRDARAMLAELHGDGAVPKFGGSYIGQDGTTRPCLHLPKRETLILVSGYNVGMRATIIDSWQELEQASPTVDPILALNDPTTLRALLLNYVEERMKLAQELAAAAPKLEAFDRIASQEPTGSAKVAVRLPACPWLDLPAAWRPRRHRLRHQAPAGADGAQDDDGAPLRRLGEYHHPRSDHAEGADQASAGIPVACEAGGVALWGCS